MKKVFPEALILASYRKHQPKANLYSQWICIFTVFFFLKALLGKTEVRDKRRESDS